MEGQQGSPDDVHNIMRPLTEDERKLLLEEIRSWGPMNAILSAAIEAHDMDVLLTVRNDIGNDPYTQFAYGPAYPMLAGSREGLLNVLITNIFQAMTSGISLVGAVDIAAEERPSTMLNNIPIDLGGITPWQCPVSSVTQVQQT